MKMKWKIILSLNAFILIVIVLISFYFHNSITTIITQDTSEELVNYSAFGLSLLDHNYPGDWHLEGENLYKGDTLMNENYEVIDEISNDTGILATLFAGDTRIATTVIDENGKPQIGTTAADKVVETVLVNKEVYQGSAVIVGSDADTYYIPLKDKAGNPVGMWFVGIYSEEINKKINNRALSMIAFMAVLLGIGSFLSYFIGRVLADGFNKVKKDIEQLEQGYFKIEFPKKMLNQKDEVGDITRSFFNMQNRISSIIFSIKKETANIEAASTILVDGAKTVYNDVEDISATTEELSAGMEETAASAQEMNATAVEIETEIGNMADKANHGQSLALEIEKRAKDLKEVALTSQSKAVEIYNDTNKKLRESIEKTKAIEEIKALSKTILAITAQTNLLALNASIESARAGEAGKGFAVVANEISTLAKNSKSAVSKIEEISNDISGAVEGMVADCEQLLGFVDNKVIHDYRLLVQTGEQYYEDASMVENMVTEIKNSATLLTDSIHYIKQAVEEVTVATTEGSKGSADIAQKSTSIFHKTTQVLEQANANQDISANLGAAVEFFKI